MNFHVQKKFLSTRNFHISAVYEE